MTLPNLSALRALAEKATPGPWKTASGKGSASVRTEHPEYNCAIYLNVRTCEIEESVKRWQSDAAFIAAASPDVVLALLDEIERLNQERDDITSLRAQLDALRKPQP